MKKIDIFAPILVKSFLTVFGRGFTTFGYLSIKFLGILLGLPVGIFFLAGADAATLQLSWVDNSTNEDGFNIERKVAVGGRYGQIATVGTNVTYYADENLPDGTAFCYRVNAFNIAGASPYSAEVCATAQDAQSFLLSTESDGSVTSIPPAVTSTGRIRSTLTLQVIGAMTSAGSGTGKVVSRPNGIHCGSKCLATFRSNVAVTLQAIPAKGSIFAGWSGDADCADGSITMTRNISCAATFQPLTYALSVSLIGSGTGKVTSDLTGIDCGATCVARFAEGTKVKLTAIPAPDSLFSGWTGDHDCRNSTLTVKSEKTCVAAFAKRTPSKVGIYRPSTGAWYLTTTSTAWYGCNVDRCLEHLSNPGNLPITGNWDGGGKSKLGIYDSEQNTWAFDIEALKTLQGCGLPTCVQFTVPQTSVSPLVPVTGSWDGSGIDLVGIYQLVLKQSDAKIARHPERQGNEAARIEPSAAEGHIGYWYLDRNGNGAWDGCNKDRCLGPFGGAGDIPIVGDWNGNGVSKIGVFNPQSGLWYLDYNGNGKWNGCHNDRCLGPFGLEGDIPAVGDWDSSGTAKIGVFRPLTGEWFLDVNGNGQWDGCSVDRCLSGFGQEGDLPVVGKW